MQFRALILAACVGLVPDVVAGQSLDGEKTIRLLEPNGHAHVVGRVIFRSDDIGSEYSIIWEEEVFSDHFLSMRPFRCLEGPEKHWCRVPYPYDIKRRITDEDLTDLEYDLLFIWKGATEYGINMWNGVYYDLTLADGQLAGELREIDMDVLSAPPPAGELRPVKPGDLHVSDPDGHWLSHISIE